MSALTASSTAMAPHYRSALFFVAGIAAAYGLYLLQRRHAAYEPPPPPGGRTTLRRSNAVHRPNRRSPRAGAASRDSSNSSSNSGSSSSGQEREHSAPLAATNEPPDSDFWLPNINGPWEEAQFGSYLFTDAEGTHRDVPLSLVAIPSTAWLVSLGFTLPQAQMHRSLIETQYLQGLMRDERRWRTVTELDGRPRATLQAALLASGFSRATIDDHMRRAAAAHGLAPPGSGAPTDATEAAGNNQEEEHSQHSADRTESQPDSPAATTASTMAAAAAAEAAEAAAADGEIEDLQRGDTPSGARGGRSLLKLLFYIAEDQARREGYRHRGVTCNSCGMLPIRGVRFRCANCADFDLCESCEAAQAHHPKTHLFYKMRVPAPFLANPRHAQPVWYPGRPGGLVQTLPKPLVQSLSAATGYDDAELEALWDQFKCLAATEWPDDPHDLRRGIDRRTFDRCFCPAHLSRVRPPQLIYDRIFAFYDTNGDGLIGFEEFVRGVASVNSKSQEERLRRVYQGYDIDGDGFVDRRDFLRMFRAYYALNRDLTREMIQGIEEDDNEEANARDMIHGRQPISAMFTNMVPPGMASHRGEGKLRNTTGDLEIFDGAGILAENSDYTMTREEIVAEAAERSFVSMALRQSRGYPWQEEEYDVDAEQDELFRAAVGDDRQRTRFLAWAPPSSSSSSSSSSSDGGGGGGGDEGARDSNGDVRRPARNAGTGHDGHYSGDHDGGAHDDGAHDADRDESSGSSDGSGWPPSWVRVVDVQVAFAPEVRQVQDVRSPEDRGHVMAAARRRMALEDSDIRERVRGQAWADRWRRRRFYVDEEEGAVAPAGYSEADDIYNGGFDDDDDDDSGGGDGFSSHAADTADAAHTGSSQRDDGPEPEPELGGGVSGGGGGGGGSSVSDAASQPPSPRSRSSSRVRFWDHPTAASAAADDADAGTGAGASAAAHETRSNPSTSSRRSIPYGERWGGYVIPEAERDVGREILYQVTQQGLNELLDALFLSKENLALEVVETREERRAFRRLQRAGGPYCYGGGDGGGGSGSDGVAGSRSKRSARETTASEGKEEEEAEEADVEGNDEEEEEEEEASVAAGTSTAAARIVAASAPPIFGEVVDIDYPLHAPHNVIPLSVSHDERAAEPLSPSPSLSNVAPAGPAVATAGGQSGGSSAAAAADSATAAAVSSSSSLPATTTTTNAASAAVAAAATTTTAEVPPTTESDSGHVDPTLPQHRPNSASSSSSPSSSSSSSSQSQIAAASTRTSGGATNSRRPPPSPPSPPQATQSSTHTPKPPAPSATAANTSNVADRSSTSPSPPPPPSSSSSSPSQPSQPLRRRQRPPPPPPPPSPRRQEYLRQLDEAEAEIRRRGGPGRLDFAEFRQHMTGETGERLGFLASWIEMATF